MSFDTLKDNFSLPQAEEKILEYWDKHDVFHKAQKAAMNRWVAHHLWWGKY